MTTQHNAAFITDVCTRRINCLDNYVSPKTEIGVNGEVLKMAGVKQIYQDCLDSRAAITQKRAELKAAIADGNAAEKRRRDADRSLRGWVANQFGVDSQEVYEFGFPPRKVPVKTVEAKYGAVLQSRATRKARHTMGKNQKSNVIGVVVVPSDAAQPAEQPAASASPATAAKPNGATNGSAASPASSPNGHATNGSPAPV